MNREVFYYALFLVGVAISAFAQILLKKSASRKAEKNIFTFIDKRCPKISARINEGQKGIWALIRKHKKLLAEYLNPFTMFAYTTFIAATFLTIFSYKVVPLTVAPILGATEYFFIAALSRILLKEKVNLKKAAGLLIIVVGILVYSI